MAGLVRPLAPPSGPTPSHMPSSPRYLTYRAAWRPAVLVALPAVLIAGTTRCSGDATSPAAQPAGTYTLRTINGQALPFLPGGDSGYGSIYYLNGSYAISGHVLTLAADGTLTLQETVLVTPTAGAPPSPQTRTIPGTGTWTRSGAAVTLQVVGSPPVRGTFSGGNTLTMAESLGTFVYEK